ncbi:MAG: DUF2848 family protein [Pseudomonadota bacterium]
MGASLEFDTPERPVAMAPERCLIAGWTGRDAAKVAHHIEELAAIGVRRPSATPLYYQVPETLLTHAERIAVLGDQTGGEAEPVIFHDGSRRWLGLGSDHTDRALEATSVAHSKAVCAKPVSRRLWLFDEVAERLDSLRLTSEISADGSTWTPYQDGTLAAIRPLEDLAAAMPGGEMGAALFCGTLPAIGGVRPTPWFRAALFDPETDRGLSLRYTLDVLPVVA